MILLIQPSVGRYEKISTRMPLGLLYIASYLKKHDVASKIIDTRINKRWEKELIQELKEADIVGISCMIGPQIKNALKIAEFIKAKKPATTIVFGGAHPTLIPGEALKEPCIDVVVRGEGEKPFLELAKKQPLSKIKGISFKDPNGKIIHNLPQGLLKAEEIPIPDYSFLDMGRYSSISYAGEKGLDIQGSRGCPYACGFCYNEEFNGRVWRPFPIENVLKNIDILVKEYGAKNIYFVDDNVATNQKHFVELLKKIKQKPYKINVGFQGIRIDALERFTDETYKLLHESGVRSIDIGVETLNEKFLKKVDKSITADQIRRALEKIEKHNFNLKLNFILGLPGQTKEDIDYDIKEAEKLAEKHKNSYVLLNVYIPYPNTKLYEEAIKAGLKQPSKFRDWSVFAGTSWMKKYSWFPRKTIKYLEYMSFLFLLSNKNNLVKVTNKLVKAIVMLYQPIALFRLKHRFYFFMIEKKIVELLD